MPTLQWHLHSFSSCTIGFFISYKPTVLLLVCINYCFLRVGWLYLHSKTAKRLNNSNIKTLLFRMNANFMLFVNLGGFLYSSVSYRRVWASGEERLTPRREAAELSISSHTKDQKRCPGLSLHWDASHLIVICLFSLWRWGPPSHIVLDQSSV